MSVYIKFTLTDRSHIDPTTGNDVGGKNYPVISTQSIKWFEKDFDFLCQFDMTLEDAATVTEFNANILTDEQAQDWINENYPMLIPAAQNEATGG